MEQTRLFFFGDSICFGQGVSLHKGWIPRISAQLSEISEKTGRDILVVNTSVNGRTTRQALENMPYEVQSHNPDILLVQFGMNDCNYWETDRGNPRVSHKAFAANLEEIISRAFSFGAKKVFLNTNHPTTRTSEKLPHTNLTYQQSNEAYNRIIREVATSYGQKVILNDVEQAFKEKISAGRSASDFVLSDRLHLSEEGHDLYFETVGKRILGYMIEHLGSIR